MNFPAVYKALVETAAIFERPAGGVLDQLRVARGGGQILEDDLIPWPASDRDQRPFKFADLRAFAIGDSQNGHNFIVSGRRRR